MAKWCLTIQKSSLVKKILSSDQPIPAFASKHCQILSIIFLKNWLLPSFIFHPFTVHDNIRLFSHHGF